MRIKSWYWIALVSLTAFFCAAGNAWCQLITQAEAQRVGLTRQWYAQVQMDSGITKVHHVLLDRDTLFVSTHSGQIHAFNAETGASMWAIQCGRRDLPTLEMDASDHYLATINGVTAYVFNRFNGKLLWQMSLENAPGAGPAVSASRIYIPGLKGRIQSYPLRLVTDSLKELGRDEKTLSPAERETLEIERRESLRIDDQYVEPLNVQALGKVFVQPRITREDDGSDFIAWPTSNGDLSVGEIRLRSADYFPIKYIIETGKDISSRPSCIPFDREKPQETGRIYAASRDGYIYCVRETDGDQQWQYPCSEPITQQIAVIISDTTTDGKTKTAYRLFAPTLISGMFCLDALSSDKLWWTPNIKKFLAQSTNRVYALDQGNNIVALNLETGQQLGATPVKANNIQFVNEINDRIYLVNDKGLVQCLRQIDHDKPYFHQQNPEGKKDREIIMDNTPKKTVKKTNDEDDLFGNEEGEEAGDDPFGAGADDAGGADAEDDPFGAGGDDAAGADDDPFGAGADDAGGADADDDPFGAGADDAGGADAAGADDAEDPFGAGADDAGGADAAGADDAEDPFGGNPFG